MISRKCILTFFTRQSLSNKWNKHYFFFGVCLAVLIKNSSNENVNFSKLPQLTTEKSKTSKLVAAYYDPGILDSFPKVVIGGDLAGETVHKILFLEAANFLTKKQLSFGLKRLIQVDIDDALMPAKLRENALSKADIDAMIKFQKEISSTFVKNFKLAAKPVT